jgi:hypothetical protein
MLGLRLWLILYKILPLWAALRGLKQAEGPLAVGA